MPYGLRKQWLSKFWNPKCSRPINWSFAYPEHSCAACTLLAKWFVTHTKVWHLSPLSWRKQIPFILPLPSLPFLFPPFSLVPSSSHYFILYSPFLSFSLLLQLRIWGAFQFPSKSGQSPADKSIFMHCWKRFINLAYPQKCVMPMQF